MIFILHKETGISIALIICYIVIVIIHTILKTLHYTTPIYCSYLEDPFLACSIQFRRYDWLFEDPVSRGENLEGRPLPLRRI